MNKQVLILTGRVLKGRLVRTVLIITGVTVTSMLVIILFATYGSLTAGVSSYVGQSNIDLWVAPEGSDNLIRTSGWISIPREVEADTAYHGVKTAGPVLRSFVSVRKATTNENQPEEHLTLLGIGYETPKGLAGPPIISAGRAPDNNHEVALDRAAAHRLGAEPGDSLLVSGWDVKLVGLTRGTNLLATQFVFTDIEFAWDVLGRWNEASFIAVELEPGEEPEAVTASIEEEYPEASVFLSEEFKENNLREVASGLLPIIGLVALLGIGVSSVLVALLVQGLVEERREDIAVLMALGSPAGVIGAGLVARAALLVIAGCLIGAGAAGSIGLLTDRLAPHIEFTFAGNHFITVFTLFLSAGLLATIVPVLRLRKIDPLEVFRA